MSKSSENGKTKMAPFGAVAKLKWLRVIAGRPEISRTALASCCVLADMTDANTGLSWPSYNTIAKATGTTARGTKKAIAQAIEAGLFTIAEHGTRVRSNRYRLNLAVLGSEPEDTTLGGDPQDTRVVNTSDIGGERQRHYVVNPSSHESIHLSEQEAKDRWERSQADGDAPALRPERPTLARPAGRFDEFWQAVGKRATVAESEQLLKELIANGVDYAEIVGGANRWREYNVVTGGKRATSPLKWLQRQKWLDDWTLPSTARKLDKKKPNKKKTAEPKFLDDGRVLIPDYGSDDDYLAWEKHFTELDAKETKGQEAVESHVETCFGCIEAKRNLMRLLMLEEPSHNSMCEIGLMLYQQYRDSANLTNRHYDTSKSEWRFKPGAIVEKHVWQSEKSD